MSYMYLLALLTLLLSYYILALHPWRQKMKFLALSFVILGFATAQACPVINGKFEKKNPDGSSIMIGLQTRIADNVYQYNFDVDGNGPFLPADGIARNVSGGGDTGTLRISCEGNWVQFEAKVDG